ncbi:AraC family transcriptional regulator [uncultured Tateyamaria sp.]|uniref:AraC family transcriptional regulator n=1 Tax=uncultured Tateyamaria sp. TaxID=455651 RepID=UPI0026340AC8|nr:AraC family transcriptional regulator [uncultured Tateyamaria sp.]
MDPLSDILSILKPQSHLAGLIDLGHPSAVAFPGQAGALKCNTMLSGQCWVAVEGSDTPVLVEQGDFFVLPSGRPFSIATGPSCVPEPLERLFSTPLSEQPAVVNGGGHTTIASCRFTVSQVQPAHFVFMLPPIIVIPAEQAAAAQLQYLVERILDEVAAARPGGLLIAQHLSHVLLVQTLRHRHDAKDGGLGWLAALADAQLSLALAAIHADIGRKWTLTALAEHAGMSRSVFARRFHDVLGETPMDYLTDLRMAKASDQLMTSSDTIAEVAERVGYKSENAFNTAFKRVVGSPPRQFANQFESSLAV